MTGIHLLDLQLLQDKNYMENKPFNYEDQSISNANSLISQTCLNIHYRNFHKRWDNYIVIDIPN